MAVSADVGVPGGASKPAALVAGRRHLLPLWAALAGWAVVALLALIGADKAHNVASAERLYERRHPGVTLTPVLVDLGDACTFLGIAVAAGAALSGASEVGRRSPRP